MNLDKLLKNNRLPKKDELTDQDLYKLFVKYKGLLKERERDKDFWEATNKNLENSYKKLDELVEKRTDELRAVNEQLQQELTERKQVEEKLKSRNKELETWAEVTVNRELFMLDLKKEINELLEKYGEKPKYEILT